MKTLGVHSLERTGDAAAKARDNGDMGSQKVVLGPRSPAAHLCLRPKHRQLAAVRPLHSIDRKTMSDRLAISEPKRSLDAVVYSNVLSLSNLLVESYEMCPISHGE